MSSAQKKRGYETRGQGRADERIPYIAQRRPVVNFRMHVVALTELGDSVGWHFNAWIYGCISISTRLIRSSHLLIHRLSRIENLFPEQRVGISFDTPKGVHIYLPAKYL